MTGSNQIGVEVEKNIVDPLGLFNSKSQIRKLLKEGNTYSIEDGDNVISIWCSAVSGKEKVYFNSDEIAASRSLGFLSRHSFNKNGHEYELNMIVQSMIKGQREVSLLKDRKLIYRKVFISGIELTWKKIGIFYLKALIIGFLAGASFAAIANYFDL